MYILTRIVRFFGPLRTLLMLLTLAVIACAPLADTRVQFGWMLGPTVIAPTLMAMLAFSLPLDMTMTRVFMLDTVDSERRRYRHIFWFEALLLAVMLVAWTPFILKLVGR